MKRFLVALAGLLLLASLAPADAAWNIRQKANGSTVWVDGNSVEVPTGPGQIVVPISSFADATTYFVVTHKPGKVKKVYAVNNRGFLAQSGSPTIDVRVSPGAQQSFTAISVGSTLTMTTALYPGRASSVSLTDASLSISQGYVIAIVVGTSGVTGDVPGNITIVIE